MWALLAVLVLWPAHHQAGKEVTTRLEVEAGLGVEGRLGLLVPTRGEHSVATPAQLLQQVGKAVSDEIQL